MSPKKEHVFLLLGILAVNIVISLYFSNTINDRSATANLATVTSAFPIEGSEEKKTEAVKGELIVKFSSNLTRSAENVLQKGESFKSALANQDTSLDALNQKVGVTSARHLFKTSPVDKSPTQLKTSQASTIQAVKTKYTTRAQRAPEGAVAPDLSNVYVLTVPEDSDIEEVARLYRSNPNVVYAQPNYIAKTQFVPNDPFFSSSNSWGQGYRDLWGLQKIQAQTAWDTTKGAGITVAVVDTGLDYNHPDIAANVWANPGDIPNNGIDDDANGYIDDVKGYDFVNHDNDPVDDGGHGTHVSGTIAAIGNNNLGIIGVAPLAKIMPLKGLDNSGGGSFEDLAEAIIYAADNGADVINNSWGCGYCPINPIAEDAVRYAYSMGVVVVFAAGNYSDDVRNRSPQNMTTSKPVVVSASTEEDTLVFFSSYGMPVDVAAPGGGATDLPQNILSLKLLDCGPPSCPVEFIVGGQYLRLAGTSMAAPHVAGAAALILSVHPAFTNENVRQALRASSDDVETPWFDIKTGAGRINVARAVLLSSVPNIRISSPLNGKYFNHPTTAIMIKGIAGGAGFQSYQLSYALSKNLNSWTNITSLKTTPTDEQGGNLGIWNIQSMPTGFYTLRLIVTTSAGYKFQDLIQVSIEKQIIQQLSMNPYDQMEVTISGNRIVWDDYRNLASTGVDMWLHDLSTGVEQGFEVPYNQSYHAIDGNGIVYEQDKQNIYYRNLDTSAVRQITMDGAYSFNVDAPDISGQLITWMDYRNGGTDIYLYDLTLNRELRITSNPDYQMFPAISGNRIVWDDEHDGRSYIHTCLYNPTTNTCPEERITTHMSARGSPAISGNRIVWEDFRNGNSDIYLYDMSTRTEQRITTDPANQFNPSISDRWIAWIDDRNGTEDIYVYDLQSMSELQITAHFIVPSANHYNHRHLVAVDGDTVVWADDRNGNPDIYAATLTPPLPPEITVLGNGMTIAYGDTVPSTADHTNFGVVTQGSTAVVRTFTVKNTGTGALTTSTLILPTGFSLVEGLSASIAPGASDTFQVKMDTIARGEKTGNISFTNNDSDENPFYFTIIGRVIGPEIVVLGNGVIIIDGDTTPSTADQTNFGTVVKNSAPPVRTFTIKNDGTSTLNLVVPQHPLGFSIIDYLEPSLAPGASDLLKVKMDTSLTGTNTGQISFTNNDSDENPFNFTITGTVTL